jgi:hypothetical protein
LQSTSRLYDGKRLSRLSAPPGRKTLRPSSSTLATSSRDQTLWQRDRMIAKFKAKK